MLALERRNLILENLKTDKCVFVADLSKQFNVSEETIRRDLAKICNEGLAIKSYGGAILNEDTNIELPFNIRKNRHVEEKQKIAKLFQNIVDDGDFIVLDGSTTAVFIAKAIKIKERLTIITNSIEVIIELSNTSFNIISTGGNLKEGYLALVGPKSVENLNDYNTDIAILSCKGIHEQKGITDGIELFSQTKQAMLNSAKKRILAVDSSKFGTVAFYKIANITDVDIVVTDCKPSKNWLDLFADKGVTCIYPEDNELV